MLIVFCGHTKVGDIDGLKSFYAKHRVVYLLPQKGSDEGCHRKVVSNDALHRTHGQKSVHE